MKKNFVNSNICCNFARFFRKKQAQVAELVDALVSNTNGKPCRFDPGPGYKKGGECNDYRSCKKFKRKFDKTGVIKELRARQQFDKPSELKRVKMAHAKYVQSLHAHDDK